MSITTIGFDADDTLWHSETYFSITEQRFHALLAPWCEPGDVAERLLTRERANLAVFGYGIKGFTLSMIETAIELTDATIPVAALAEIIEWGKEMLRHPVELLPGAADLIDDLAGSYRLALITKGDLFHQESKIAESGLADRFDSIDVLAEKDMSSYRRVLDRLGVAPHEFLMVGNSVRSDVLPIVELGAHAVHIPYAITWGHEIVDPVEAGAAEGEPAEAHDPEAGGGDRAQEADGGNGRWTTLGSLHEVRDHVAAIGSRP